MYVSKTFTEAKKSVLCAEYPSNELKFHLSKLTTYFSQLIDKSLKIEEVEYLIYYVKFIIWPAIFYVSFLFSHYFSMLVLACILFYPIYAGIEN